MTLHAGGKVGLFLGVTYANFGKGRQSRLGAGKMESADAETLYLELVELWQESRTKFVKAAMDLVRSNPKRTCAKSYIHDNGFKKISIFESKDKMQSIRLHCWDSYFFESNIHGHCFDLRSTVLAGELIDRIYGEGQGGESFPKFRYKRRDIRQSYGLVYEGIAYVVERAKSTYSSGDSYLHTHDILHSSQPASDRVVTLFFTDRTNVPNYTFVYKRDAPLKDQKLASPSMRESEIEDVLKYVGIAPSNSS